MISELFTRRDFAATLATLVPALTIVEKAFGSTVMAQPQSPQPQSPRDQSPRDQSSQDQSRQDQEISHAAESIHQEVVFQAGRQRVYEALTDAKQFTGVTSFSPVKAAPAEISRQVGGAFSCFGGHIVGRHVELVPSQRIVQAWRVVTWDAGMYSIARFELKEQGSATRLVFDHTGFPLGKAEHLAEGWKTNYWEPMRKYLASANRA